MARQIAVDSRKVTPGAEFYALPGERVDGHAFLEHAAERGAVIAHVLEGYTGGGFGMDLIYHPNVLLALQERAQEALKSRSCHTVGITGSVGKTTVKEFTADLLATKFRVARSKESYNGQIGLPISILEADLDADILVLEMGMNQPGEMDRLVEIAPIDTALITWIAESHIEFFDSLQDIAYEKSRIFSALQTKRRFASAQANTFAPIAAYAPEICPEIESPFTQKHLAHCFSCAATIALSLGMTRAEIAVAAKKLRTPKRRFTRLEIDGVIFIDDTYNASVASMEGALASLPEGRRIAVLGEMGELGDQSVEAHLRVGAFAKKHVDHLFAFGENGKLYCDGFGGGETFTDFDALRDALYQFVEPGDVVLVKGSNAKRMWRLFEKSCTLGT